ncbi:MAG: carbamoyl phosphate synthase small subunit [Clostridia bacterium]|nr:carbamoyl phosphate synthase small subunit [Clostridia bacterium]
MKKAFLALADGTVFEGKSLGAIGTTIGEIVFTTGMTGYVETITDPTYAGQIVTMTYPIIGNYGVNREDCQSSGAQVKGLIMKECAAYPNNFRSEEDLEEFLISENVIAITGIDTRALTKMIRTHGAMNGMITTEEPFSFEEHKDAIQSYKVGFLADEVTCKEPYTVGEGNIHVAMMDYGLKKSILESLASKGVTVTVYPAKTKAEVVLAQNPDGIMLSNGPGNPEDYTEEIAEIKKLMASGKPFFGVCLGHQLAALAMGGKTEKLKFGHRGANQPVKDLKRDQTFVTVQNHGYTVVTDSLDASLAEITHINLNDQSVEGIRYKNLPAFTLQFHPDSKPGAKSSKYLFEEFISMMGGNCNA